MTNLVTGLKTFLASITHFICYAGFVIDVLRFD